ncbi:MAG: diacylglycerol kinase family protein [Chitinophagales bacterium]
MKRFLKSFHFALQGWQTALSEQPNLRFHLTALLLATILGLAFNITFYEWLAVFIVAGLVITAELFNSAIEKVVDLASPSIHPMAKQAKDIAAGAVLAAAATAAATGILIYGKYLLQFLSDYL